MARGTKMKHLLSLVFILGITIMLFGATCGMTMTFIYGFAMVVLASGLDILINSERYL